jgi:hypothetical protein
VNLALETAMLLVLVVGVLAGVTLVLSFLRELRR